MTVAGYQEPGPSGTSPPRWSFAPWSMASCTWAATSSRALRDASGPSLLGTEHGEICALLPPITFDDIEAPMRDVPALGQHTRSLLGEAGLETSQVDQALTDGIGYQAEVATPVVPS